MAMLAAILSISPPMVRELRSAPVYDTRDRPSPDACTISVMDDREAVSSKKALTRVAQAPATVACPAAYVGCCGQPSGNAWGSSHAPLRAATRASASEFITSECKGYRAAPVLVKWTLPPNSSGRSARWTNHF